MNSQRVIIVHLRRANPTKHHQFRNHMNIYEHPWKSVKIHGHVDENRLHKPFIAGFMNHLLLDNQVNIQPRATRPFSSVRAMERCRSKALEAWHSPPAFGGDSNVINHPPVITIFRVINHQFDGWFSWHCYTHIGGLSNQKMLIEATTNGKPRIKRWWVNHTKMMVWWKCNGNMKGIFRGKIS